jgi:hypothetical protein
MTPDHPKSLLSDEKFTQQLGAFWVAWNRIELITSVAIGHILGNRRYATTHIITAGLEFGRKANLLRNLLHEIDATAEPARPPVMGGLIRSIGRLQNESKRNAIAHGIFVADDKTVTFIDLPKGGAFIATPHRFTLKELKDHTDNVMRIGEEIRTTLRISETEIQRFAMAALKVNTKSTKSPLPPSSKA